MAGRGQRNRLVAGTIAGGEMKLIAALLMVVVAMMPATAAAKQKIRNGVVQNESLDQYLVRMQQRPGAAEVKSLGSLWSDNGRLASIASDFKAMHVGDL